MTGEKDFLKAKEGLDLDKVKDLTVEEAVRKESEIKAGITEADGVLDKYIKQNRDKVSSQKFDNIDLAKLDTAVLDNFIKQQREELAQEGLIDEPEEMIEEQPVIPAVGTTSVKPSIFDDVEVTEPSTPTRSAGAADDFILGNEADAQPVYKNKKRIIGGLAALLIGIFGVGYALNQLGKQASSTVTSSSPAVSSASSSSSKTDAATAKADFDSFTDLYGKFFADAEKTKLKNSEFANLPNLEVALNKLKGTSYYDKAKTDYDKLSKSIAAVQAINGKFDTEAIVDGEKMAASLKADANLDDLSSDVLNTGNASLDTLLQSVIAEARTNSATTATVQTDGQSAESTVASEQTAEQTNGEQATQNQTPVSVTEGGTTGDTTQAQPASSAPVSAPVQDASNANPVASNTASSIGADSSVLQRNLSRVPYNDAAIADTANPAWAFNPGVLENIINISRARGYFTDNNYYVEPVNIINGNGYYNMFKSDGTYLFSINAKTGYFVGNAPGNADNLDY